MTTWLVTGGTGSFGQAFTRFLLQQSPDCAIRVFSRDEQKQDRMKREFNNSRVRYLLGDVRDRDRVRRAVAGCDVVVHAAALKIIPAGEYNPDEVIKTNVGGSENVINACIDQGVPRLVLISSDKAVAPANLYGGTKLCMEKLGVLANNHSGAGGTRIAAARYGNVLGSRGSILTLLRDQATSGEIRITDPQMTRFWITLPMACHFVQSIVLEMRGGEVFIPKLPATLVEDLCKTLYPGTPIRYVGMRPGEKVHEWLTNEYEVADDVGWCYIIREGRWRLASPLCSRDAVVPATALLDRPEFGEEIRAVAA